MKVKLKKLIFPANLIIMAIISYFIGNQGYLNMMPPIEYSKSYLLMREIILKSGTLIVSLVIDLFILFVLNILHHDLKKGTWSKIFTVLIITFAFYVFGVFAMKVAY